jgi:hypothetical protein
VKETTVRRIRRANRVSLIHGGSLIDLSDLVLSLGVELGLKRKRSFCFFLESFPQIGKLTFQPPANRNIIKRIEHFEKFLIELK